MRTIVIGFGLLTLCLLLLFKVAEVQYTQGNARLEIIVAIAAVVFFFIGWYVNKSKEVKASRKETKSDHPVTAPFTAIDHERIKKIGLSARELDVLKEMTKGSSNQEIAQTLFLSESTIKTHVSNILLKLDVKNRVQAIQTAKYLRIIE